MMSKEFKITSDSFMSHEEIERFIEVINSLEPTGKKSIPILFNYEVDEKVQEEMDKIANDYAEAYLKDIERNDDNK
jgi:hypothetical protein